MDIRKHTYLICLWTIAVFGMAILSDLLEWYSHGFSTGQIHLTYLAFLGIPYSVIGLYALNYRKGGKTLLIGSLAFGLSYIFFAGTALYVMVEESQFYLNLIKRLGLIYELHGLLLVIGGLLVGWAIIKNKLAYPWTGRLIILSSIISLLGAFLPGREISYMFGNFSRYLGYIGFGVYMLAKKSEA